MTNYAAVPDTMQSSFARPDQRDIFSIIRQMNLSGTFVEIGTYGGHFAHDLFKICQPQKLFCVDPYMAYDNFKDALNSHPLDDVFAEAKARLSAFGDKVEFLRMFSEEAAGKFADNSLDFVYVDGNHAYQYAKKDFECWFPKLRDGGLMCGDDATDSEGDDQRNAEGDVVRIWSTNADGTPKSWGHYGVLKAGKEFAVKHGLQLFQAGSQCLMFKGQTPKFG